MHKGHHAYNTTPLVGTGAAINVSLGFIPDSVEIWNETKLSFFMWRNGMTGGVAPALKQVTAGTMTKITTGGIAAYAGVEGTTPPGFTIGTDGQLNAASDVIWWKAISNDA